MVYINPLETRYRRNSRQWTIEIYVSVRTVNVNDLSFPHRCKSWALIDSVVPLLSVVVGLAVGGGTVALVGSPVGTGTKE